MQACRSGLTYRLKPVTPSWAHRDCWLLKACVGLVQLPRTQGRVSSDNDRRCNKVAPTLSRPLRGLRQGVAHFHRKCGKRQAARSAACPFDCAGEICKPRSGVKSSPQPSAVPQQGQNPQTCSSSISVPLKSLGCRNSTGLPCAPIFGSPSPSTRAPAASKRSRAAPISWTS